MATYVRTQSIEHIVGDRGRLALKITAGDVRVRGIAGNEARVRATFEIRADSEADADRIYDQSRLRVDRSSTQLTVEVAQPAGSSAGGVIGRLFSGGGRVELSVEADMPRLAELRLETVSADVTVDGTHGEQRYATVSGDLFMTEVGGSVRVNTVSGDATLRANRPLSVRVEAVSGDVSLAAPRVDALRAHGVSGDVEVEGELAAGGEFRVETVSGDLVVGLLGGATFEVRGLSTDIVSDLDHRVEGRLDRRRVVIGAGTPLFLFSSMSGDLVIHRPRRISLERPPSAASLRGAARSDQNQLAVLQALERGEIDVDEAARRLESHTEGETDG